MPKAQVTLKLDGPKSFTGAGRTIVPGQRIIVTKEEDIAYYQKQGGLVVEMLDESSSAKSNVKDSMKTPVATREVNTIEANVNKTDEGIEPMTGEVNEESLQRMTKNALIEYADISGIQVNPQMSKNDIVKAILSKQQA